MNSIILLCGMGYEKKITIPLFSLLAILIIAFSGCMVTPSSETASQTIRQYFTDRQYSVISLEIGEIASIPLKEKTYMGLPTYTVQIKSIILEVTEDIGEPWNYHKGERLTFENAVIHLREPSRSGGNWIIAGLSGIPVP